MRCAVAFTGGKDSTLVVTAYQLLAGQDSGKGSVPAELVERCLVDGQPPVVGVLVTFCPAGGQNSFKAHPLPVIRATAASLKVPHVVKEIEGPDYLASYIKAIQELTTEHHIDALATGDILDVCSNFMGRAAEGAGVPLLRPLWGIPRRQLLEHVWALGLQPLITCVNTHKFKSPPTLAPTDHALPTPLTTPATTQEPSNGTTTNGAAPVAGGVCHGSDAAGADADSHYSCLPPRKPEPTIPDNVASVVASLDPVRDVLGEALTRELHARVLVPCGAAMGVDEAGEYGEFHTVCVDGPTFSAPLRLETSKCHDPPGSEYAYLNMTVLE